MTFNPDWSSPPGDTIRDLLKERRIPHWRFRNVVLGGSDHDLVRLLHGDMLIRAPLARKLSAFFGITSLFWLQRELDYRRAEVKIAKGNLVQCTKP